MVARHPEGRTGLLVTCSQQFLLLLIITVFYKVFLWGWGLVGMQYMVEEEMGREKEKRLIRA